MIHFLENKHICLKGNVCVTCMEHTYRKQQIHTQILSFLDELKSKLQTESRWEREHIWTLSEILHCASWTPGAVTAQGRQLWANYSLPGLWPMLVSRSPLL